MEETLGKRIVANRKRLGLTQDALAEKLGVTAQAVSKWENDQSCPDITMLPKLALLFDITTDELLGLERKLPVQAEIVTDEKTDEAEPERRHFSDGDWEFKWDSDRRSGIGLGIWVLLAGVMMILGNVVGVGVGLLDVLLPTGLLVFGLFGIYPRFSIFRLGCSLLGVGLLLDLLECIPFSLNLEQLLPIILLFLGLHLLINALRRPRHGCFNQHHNGKTVPSSDEGCCDTVGNYCTYHEESFDCAAGFGEQRYLIQLPRLSGGKAELGFGELTVDLSGCGEISEGCLLQLKSGFGELELLVPRKWKVLPHSSASFGGVDIQGHPDPDAESVIRAYCSASFGSITIRYI